MSWRGRGGANLKSAKLREEEQLVQRNKAVEALIETVCAEMTAVVVHGDGPQWCHGIKWNNFVTTIPLQPKWQDVFNAVRTHIPSGRKYLLKFFTVDNCMARFRDYLELSGDASPFVEMVRAADSIFKTGCGSSPDAGNVGYELLLRELEGGSAESFGGRRRDEYSAFRRAFIEVCDSAVWDAPRERQREVLLRAWSQWVTALFDFARVPDASHALNLTGMRAACKDAVNAQLAAPAVTPAAG